MVPTQEFLDANPGFESLMFQAVGFLGTSGTTAPAFPGTENDTVVDNNIVWVARLDNVNPLDLNFKTYYVVETRVTLS